ncbi:MAG: hypothetical protein QM820_27505 [Minicystis sp.]
MNELTLAMTTFASLADLTGNEAHQGRPLPDGWLDALVAAFPDAEVTDEEPPAPGSQLHALIPGTRIVVKTKPFVLDLIRGTAGIWLMIVTGNAQHPAWLLWTGASLLDAFRRMKTTIDKLDENDGEACTYAAVVRASEPALRRINAYPEPDDVWNAHRVVREACPVATCRYHDGNGCRIERPEIDVVVERLVGRGILEQKGLGLWPTT